MGIIMVNIKKIRREYSLGTLDTKSIKKDPLEQFELWLKDAIKMGVKEPNGMTVTTTNHDGNPSARTMLLKDFDKNGLVFFTNYESPTAQHLEKNPNVAIVFWWAECERQICIRGIAEKISETESNEYFLSREKGAKLSALISKQSQPLENREKLLNEYQQVKTKYPNPDDIKRPKNWGGYRVKPYQIEFWQGRENRLHDRIQFNLTENGRWKITRLYP